MLKRILLSLLIISFIPSIVYPAWKYNRFTKKYDYYEVGVPGGDHTTMIHLDYSSSGHTGFQPAGSYLTSYTETDPIVKALSGIIKSNGSVISAITDNSANWDIAYGWGDHSVQNYFDIDIDTLDDIPDGTTYKLLTAVKNAYIDQSVISGSSPNFNNSNMTGNISVWTNDSGYSTSTISESDTLATVVARGSIANGSISASGLSINAVAWNSGDNIGADAIVDGVTNAIPTLTQETNWNNAYGWGNHSLVGYLNTEQDTLYSVVNRGSIAGGDISASNITITNTASPQVLHAVQRIDIGSSNLSNIKNDGSNNLTFYDVVTGTKTLAQLSAGGSNTAQLHFDIDGSSSPLTTGAKAWVRVPFNMTLTGWDITADVSGSIVIDVWNDTYGNFPPTVADTMIATGTKPVLSSAQKNQDATIDWADVTINAGEYIRINIDSIDTVTKVTLDLYGTKN